MNFGRNNFFDDDNRRAFRNFGNLDNESSMRNFSNSSRNNFDPIQRRRSPIYNDRDQFDSVNLFEIFFFFCFQFLID